MSFLGSILGLIKSRENADEALSEKEREALRQAWGLDADDPVLESADAPHEATDPSGTTYDQQIWRKKIIRTVSDPSEIGRDRFFEHVAALWNESHALGLAPEVTFQTAKDAFRGAVRHVLADNEITQAEHIYLDELKEALGLPNEMAAEITREVANEAAAIFKSQVEGL